MQAPISAASSAMPALSTRPITSPKVGDRVHGLPGGPDYAKGFGRVVELLPYVSGTGYGLLPAMRVEWETPYIPNPKKPRVATRSSVVNCGLFAVVEAAKVDENPATIAEPAAPAPTIDEQTATSFPNGKESHVPAAPTLFMGERVRSTATGRTGHLKAQADAQRVVVTWEGNGEEATVYESSLLPAPQLAPPSAVNVTLEYQTFPRAVVARAMHELCIEELKSANLAALSRKTSITAAKLSAWRKKGEIPAAHLQQLFEALEVTIRALEERAESYAEADAPAAQAQEPPAEAPKAESPEPETPVAPSNVIPLFGEGRKRREYAPGNAPAEGSKPAVVLPLFSSAKMEALHEQAEQDALQQDLAEFGKRWEAYLIQSKENDILFAELHKQTTESLASLKLRLAKMQEEVLSNPFPAKLQPLETQL